MNRLKQIRKSAGISQEELSRLTNIHKYSIGRHERGGGIDRDILRIYADVFQMPIEFILGEPNDILGRFDEEERMLDFADLFSARFRAYNYEDINNGNQYYFVWEKHQFGEIFLGAHSRWKGYSEDGEYEIRIPILVKKPTRREYEASCGKIMIVNCLDEALAMTCFGGVALIEKELCEQFYYSLFHRGIYVERNNLLMAEV